MPLFILSLSITPHVYIGTVLYGYGDAIYHPPNSTAACIYHNFMSS